MQPSDLNASQRAAITLQVEQRIGHAAKNLLPGLHGLANLLSEATSPAPTHDLHELLEVLTTIQARLQPPGNLVVSSSNLIPDTLQKTTVSLSNEHYSTPPPQNRRRKNNQRQDLLPPSPERRQKRKDSHAPF